MIHTPEVLMELIPREIGRACDSLVTDRGRSMSDVSIAEINLLLNQILGPEGVRGKDMRTFEDALAQQMSDPNAIVPTPEVIFLLKGRNYASLQGLYENAIGVMEPDFTEDQKAVFAHALRFIIHPSKI